MYAQGMSTISSLLGQVSHAFQELVITPQASSTNTSKPPPPTLDELPQLLEQLRSNQGIKSAAAAKRIYQLCDVAHKHNRVPMVCSGKYNVLGPLAKCLSRRDTPGLIHLSCLALNNLSIPPENKPVMSHGPASMDIIAGLCQVIAEDLPCESYLACIVLQNLSFLESCTSFLQCSPTKNTAAAYGGGTKNCHIPPLENPDSLLRVLEKFLTTKSRSLSPSAAAAAAGISPTAAKQEESSRVALRWACGLIKNLAKNEENAALIGQTDIPKCLVENIRRSFPISNDDTNNNTTASSGWAYNSLEFFSLFAILHLAQWPGGSSRKALIQAGALAVLTPMMMARDDVGVESSSSTLPGLLATMVCAFLDASWDAFPRGGTLAAKDVAELMKNIVEKKGKEGHYDYGFFKLSTATMAYRDLARAAVKADADGDHSNNDESSNNYTNTKVFASPSAVALILQVISNVVISSSINDDAQKGVPLTHDTPDDAMLSAEYAVEALEAMLRAILQAANDPAPLNSSVQKSEKAASEISQMLLKFATVAGATSPKAKAAAIQAAMKVKQEATVTSSSLALYRPILETSHELWAQNRNRRYT